MDKAVMTNDEWAKCKNSYIMLEALKYSDHNITDKDLRLFAVRCARECQNDMSQKDMSIDKQIILCTDVAERFANGKATIEELEEVRHKYVYRNYSFRGIDFVFNQTLMRAEMASIYPTAKDALYAAEGASEFSDLSVSPLEQANWLREITLKPFIEEHD